MPRFSRAPRRKTPSASAASAYDDDDDDEGRGCGCGQGQELRVAENLLRKETAIVRGGSCDGFTPAGLNSRWGGGCIDAKKRLRGGL